MRGSSVERSDVILVGGGIMSATLGAMLSELIPGIRIVVLERLPEIAWESSQSMNNAGTGHAGNCELNYTPEVTAGRVDISKALKVNSSFEVSLQFWAHLVESGRIPNPRAFLNNVPHVAFVWGRNNIDYLHLRHEALSKHPMFQAMEYSTERAELLEWAPLVIEGRGPDDLIAGTRVKRGTDVDFGMLTRELFAAMRRSGRVAVKVKHDVTSVRRSGDGGWLVQGTDLGTGEPFDVQAGFAFLGAGGGALPLLQKAGIPEARGYAGFPVSGQWLVCKNSKVVERHGAKVYGKASIGAPPMSVPHLDTRYWNGKPALLFGPFAGFTTKYLKQGSYLDMFMSLRHHNILPMLAVARDNMDLTRYLIGQVMQSQNQRLAALREYYPLAVGDDWELAQAGQRVQIIKGDARRGGRLEFGTEVVVAADGSLAALLGASPGASTAAETMLEIIHRCFPGDAATKGFRANLSKVVPSWGKDVGTTPELLKSVRDRVDSVLGLRS